MNSDLADVDKMFDKQFEEMEGVMESAKQALRLVEIASQAVHDGRVDNHRLGDIVRRGGRRTERRPGVYIQADWEDGGGHECDVGGVGSQGESETNEVPAGFPDPGKQHVQQTCPGILRTRGARTAVDKEAMFVEGVDEGGVHAKVKTRETEMNGALFNKFEDCAVAKVTTLSTEERDDSEWGPVDPRHNTARQTRSNHDSDCNQTSTCCLSIRSPPVSEVSHPRSHTHRVTERGLHLHKNLTGPPPTSMTSPRTQGTSRMLGAKDLHPDPSSQPSAGRGCSTTFFVAPWGQTSVRCMELFSFHVCIDVGSRARPRLNGCHLISSQSFSLVGHPLRSHGVNVHNLIQRIENHPQRQALQSDLQQHRAFNPFSKEAQDAIKAAGNTELCEIVDVEPKAQCKACLAYWDVGIVYCTCGHFLRGDTADNKKYIKSVLDLFSIPNFYIRKGRPHGHRYGKKEGAREYQTANQLQKKCRKRGYLNIHDRFIRDTLVQKNHAGIGSH